MSHNYTHYELSNYSSDTQYFILENSCIVLQAVLCTWLTVALSRSVKKVICIYFKILAVFIYTA